MLYTDTMLEEVSEPANRLVTDGRYINLLIVQDIRDAYEQKLAEQKTLPLLEDNAVLVLAEQDAVLSASLRGGSDTEGAEPQATPTPVADFLAQSPIEILEGLLAGVGRVELLIQRTLSAKRHALTPRSGTLDPDDLGDDKRGEGE